jgi:large subunit ribosomal protein L1
MAHKRSRRFRAGMEKVDRTKAYSPEDGLTMLKAFPGPKFEEAVEVSVRLGIDPKKTDQLVRGSVSLPKGTGKSVRIAVFAEGAKAEEAKEAGADVVGSSDLAEKIEGGFTDFDMTIAAPDMMKYVGRLGRILGPQGKMPSPKSGTVTPNVGDAVTEFKAGKVEFRTDAGGNVHAPLGKRSFSTEDLVANLSAFMNHLSGMRPAAVKGNFVRRISVSTTMSPGAFIEYGG